MRTIITLPMPFDNWQEFEPFIKRFCCTFREFDPGCDYKIYAMCCGGENIKSVQNLFNNINVIFLSYDENGCDIGSAQRAAELQSSNALMVNMTSRCYFHREGWLKRLVDAREKYGPGLYGSSASFEGGTPHIQTHGYLLDSETFARYPHIIDSREKGQKFESGEWCLTTWFRDQSLPCYQVTFDGEQEQSEWRNPENIFRKGDQSNMLVWDRHTDIYRAADQHEKLRLAAMADGETT